MIDMYDKSNSTEDVLKTLIEEFHAGKVENFELIAELYRHKLEAIASTILQFDCDAEDVVREALSQAYSTLKKFSSQDKITSRLCQIVINQALTLKGE